MRTTPLLWRVFAAEVRLRSGELLTPREEEILKLVAEAHTNEEIAEMRVELTRYAIRRGLIEA